ncbi:hypothetical protein OIU74_010708 [Salix koriyanagi]|uniref:Uncharacterized protein n=1 Tax=Salix koriyanagi TaxID=2511006 RepID=A0A9Q0YSP8_9ROSI|nr:hypothetical protein OIU74_010708 [Salix koriyanagi]
MKLGCYFAFDALVFPADLGEALYASTILFFLESTRELTGFLHAVIVRVY